MTSDFNNRMEAQREFLKEVNSRAWPAEQLSALSEGAIQRWITVNRLESRDEIVLQVKNAGEALYFLANKSQEQVSEEYQRRSNDFATILRRLKEAMAMS
jgi:hypothetical protein